MPECKYKRVMLKVSGEALAGANGFGFDFNVALRIANEIKELVSIKKGLNNTTFTFVYNDKKSTETKGLRA